MFWCLTTEVSEHFFITNIKLSLDWTEWSWRIEERVVTVDKSELWTYPSEWLPPRGHEWYHYEWLTWETLTGFGDSAGEPTEPGLTTDALCIYHWVKAHSGNSLVIIWGHSLGTGSVRNHTPYSGPDTALDLHCKVLFWV